MAAPSADRLAAAPTSRKAHRQHHRRLKLGDPRDPDFLRQRVIYAQHPDRCVVVVAEPARPGGSAPTMPRRSNPSTSTVTCRGAPCWHWSGRSAGSGATGTRSPSSSWRTSRVVARSATSWSGLPHRRGSHPSGRSGAGRATCGRSPLRHSPFLIDIIANGIHWLYRQGYGRIDYDTEQFRQLYRLGEEHPLVFLPSHKSQLDRLSLQYSLWENDLPPNHTAGGINMNFFPVGPLVRRTGVFFIRRSFKDNADLQVGAAELPRLPGREAVLHRVLHRGGQVALGQAAAPAFRAARLPRRLLAAGQERGHRT